MNRKRPDHRPAGAADGLRRLVVVNLAIALVLSAVAAVAILSYDRMVRRSALSQLTDTARLATVYLDAHTQDVGLLIASVVQHNDLLPALQQPGLPASRERIGRALGIMRAARPTAFSMVATDADGVILGTRPTVPGGRSDVRDRAWWQQASRGRGLVISGIFESVSQAAPKVICLSVPVRDRSGALAGIVTLVEQVDEYDAFVDRYTGFGGQDLAVLDQGGVMVADGDDAATANPSMAQRVTIGREVSADPEGMLSASQTSATGWSVIAQVPVARAMRPALLFRSSALTGLAIAVIGLVLLTGLRHRTTRTRARVAAQLAESERQLTQVADASPDVLVRITPDGTVLFASLASREVLGSEPRNLLGGNLFEMIEAEAGEDLRGEVGRVVDTGAVGVLGARTLGGTRRILECSFHRVHDADDVTVMGSLRDVTTRLSARDQVEQLFQLSQDFMAVLDLGTRLVQVNPVWPARLGLRTEHLVGRRFADLFPHGETLTWSRDLDEIGSTLRVVTFENEYWAPNRDRARTLLWTAAPDPDRGLVYLVGRDITDHKDLEHALADARDRAVEASRLKSEFVATMSHEIRTPMNGVIGLTDLLLGTRLDEVQHRYVDGVRTAGDALLSVINDILDFSKIEADRLVLESVDFRLEEVVDDVVTLVRASAGAKHLDVGVGYEAGVPFALNGDPGRLRQILLNLAHNAVKFTAEGGVRLRIAPGPARRDGRLSVVFDVVDTGIGIETSQLEQLFEPFRQADEGVTRAYGGTGLGLSISRRLAELMGGTIRASSRVGDGTTFTAELVFDVAADWGRSVRGNDARGLGVLVVDGDEVNRMVMSTQLTRWGMRPVAASSSEAAMELLTERDAPAGGYDLAVIDLAMPEALSLAAEIRGVPALAALPVIVLSDSAAPDAETAAAHGVAATLAKPVQQSALFDALSRVHVVGRSVPAAPQPVPAAMSAAPQAPPAAVHHLLLVEDNEINQTVALGILKQLGYRVDVAENGREAVDATAEAHYDAILMDCQMPVMDGYTAAVELRALERTRDVPIIAMTAATFAADRQRCFDSGMDDFIGKPVRAAVLRSTLAKWLQGREPRAGATNPVPAPRVEEIPMSEQSSAPTPNVPAQNRVPADETEARLIELLGDGTDLEIELVHDIIDSFLDRSRQLVQHVADAVAARDADAIYLHAHTLVGAGLNLGFEDVVTLCRQLEQDARANTLDGCAAQIPVLEQRVEAARDRLREIAAAMPRV